MPAAICWATTSSTAFAASASNAAVSTAPPCSRSRMRSVSGFGRGRLPVWVVRMRSLLVFTRPSPSDKSVAHRSRSTSSGCNHEPCHQPADRSRRAFLHGRNRRGLCVLQCRGEQQAASVGRELERDLVHAVGLCGDQLYRECRLRRVRGARVVARGIPLGDLAASRAQPRAGAPRSAVRPAPSIITPSERLAMLGHNRKMSGAECLAEMLNGYGITHVFHVPAVLRKTMAVLEGRTDIKRLHVHGEKAAAYMADGYARASGKPGVCAAQVIGALNLAAGLRDAWLAHSPVIAMTGGRDPKTKFRKVYQEVDDVPAFELVTKFNATIDDVARFPDMVRQAFRAATSGTPGPVHLQFRGNEGQIDAEEAEMEPLCEPQFACVPPYRPVPEEGSVKAALKHLQESQRPVIVAGGGVRASGASGELVALAEALQIPVATSLNGKDAIPGNHPLSVGVVGTYSRESANRVVNRADLVCFIGTETGGMTTHFWAVPKIGTPAIQIDIDPEGIGRNYPLVAGVNGDAKVTLARMLAAVDRASAAKRKAWVEEAQRICKEWTAKYQSALTSDAVPIRPERICAELTRHVPEDGIVVVDTGHAGMWMGGMFDLRSPRQSYMRSAGHLGWAFPAGLGAKCACPDRPVITFTGDAGLWYHIAEIETAARWRINAITVVNNNSSGNQSKRGFDRVYGGTQSEQAREMWTFSKVNFARIAEEMGALGIRVEKAVEIGPAIEQALQARRPVVIDVVTDIDALAPLAVS